MNLNNQIATETETCSVTLGQYGDNCFRKPTHSGVHAGKVFETVLHYSSEDPSLSVFGYCGSCHELITDDNRGVGSCTGLFCRDHIGPAQAEYTKRNGCQSCGFEGEHEMRNYSPLWHDGDIHCGQCGAYVRMFDAG